MHDVNELLIDVTRRQVNKGTLLQNLKSETAGKALFANTTI